MQAAFLLSLKQECRLQIQSYNHSYIYSPPIPLSRPNWEYSYSFIGSQKQIIHFHLCTLHQNKFKQRIASGKLDIRDYVSRHQPSNISKIRLILDSVYANQILLHLKMEYRNEQRSRNDGLKQVKFPTRTNTQGRSTHTNLQHQQKPKDIDLFFKGPCLSRNFFSFLDPVFKGQQYNFVEPSLK